MKKWLTALPVLSLLLFSCQKEIGFDSPTNPGNGGGNTNGDLLVRALQITPSTNDTNTISFKWDVSKRLLEYTSFGRVNGAPVSINITILRESDGKIKNIVSKSSFSQGVDSTVYTVHYQGNTSQLAYVLSTQYSPLGDFKDSSVFTYSSSGQVSSKETFAELFGPMEPLSKQEYTYDGNGNVLQIANYISDFAGGYISTSGSSYTYDAHKTAIQLGEESFMVLGPENVSKNNMTKYVTNAVSSGSTYTSAFVQQQFNSFDRPIQATLTVSPQPPGYNMKLFFFYQ